MSQPRGQDLHADFIIVGGGTAGCVIARRMAERGNKVLVLEAGGRYSRLLLGPPLVSQRLRNLFSWKYSSVEQPWLDQRRLSLPLGRVLGGSSSTNAMMYCRGRASDYDGWAKLGNKGWSYAEVLPYFQRAENTKAPGSQERGRGGPLDVCGPRFRAPFSEAFVTACEELGISRNADFNADGRQGSGFFEVTQSRGERVSTARGYLASAQRTAGLSVITGATATRILLEGNRARGVEFRDGTSLRRAIADGEIVISAGAVNSPQLLMLSGVGPADRLRRLGIRPALDLPGVGENLQDHVRVPVLYQTPNRSPGDKRYWVPATVEYALQRRGVLASNCCEAGAFLRSTPEVAEPDLQFVTHFQSALHPGAVDLQFCLMTVRSRGSIRLRSSDPADSPAINPNYLSEDAEMQALLKGIAVARRLARTKALRNFPLGREILPGPACAGEKDLIRYLRSSVETCYHVAGTCKMGSDTQAVVDEQLRVRGIEALRVADASVMPQLIHGNTMAPVVMIGEKAADLLNPGVNSWFETRAS